MNRAKHGVSLAAAALLDWDAALAWIDDRFDYGETRLVALVPMENVLYFVAFVEKRYAGDPTNWWIPNRACAEAMLRSAGFEIEAHPEPEVYLCRRLEIADKWPRQYILREEPTR